MIRLVENQGGIVARDQLGAESLDGLSRTPASNGRPLILIGTDKGSPVRWRFDVAHELGHVLLHSSLRFSALRSEDVKLVERQAHRFAAAFLLPLDAFAEDCFAVSPRRDAITQAEVEGVDCHDDHSMSRRGHALGGR